ncbi:MAG: hypothetical protein AVDCRST_MAG07-2378, partial [uncultured Frankineae bacterium]
DAPEPTRGVRHRPARLPALPPVQLAGAGPDAPHHPRVGAAASPRRPGARDRRRHLRPASHGRAGPAGCALPEHRHRTDQQHRPGRRRPSAAGARQVGRPGPRHRGARAHPAAAAHARRGLPGAARRRQAHPHHPLHVRRARLPRLLPLHPARHGRAAGRGRHARRADGPARGLLRLRPRAAAQPRPRQHRRPARRLAGARPAQEAAVGGGHRRHGPVGPRHVRGAGPGPARRPRLAQRTGLLLPVRQGPGHAAGSRSGRSADRRL